MTLNRIIPALPPSAFQSYGYRAPLLTHWRDATCAEVECDAHVNGWTTLIDESTQLGQQQAYYIRKQSGRRLSELRTEAGLTEFTFPAGQRCFRPHKARLERPGQFLVAGGDWRGNPTGMRQQLSAEDWVDHFRNHQDKLAEQTR